jgi:hypothetical protein
MSALETRIDAVLAAPLSVAEAADGAIGYVGTDIPEDILRASGRVTSHLPWDADRATPLADRWIEGAFAGWARSMLNDWAAGHFDCFDKVVFSRGDDSAHRLYYYVCELQRRGLVAGPTPLVFDIALIPRKSSVAHSIRAVRDLTQRLNVSEAALEAGIVAANRRRALYAGVERHRQGPGTLYERLARASLFADIDAEIAGFEPPRAEFAGKVLLAGNAPPDERLHAAIERAGWTVAGEAHNRSLLRLGPEIANYEEDPTAAIVEHAVRPMPGGRSFFDRASWLVDEARRRRADCVIVWLIEEEEALIWNVPQQRAALAAQEIPALFMTRRRWDAADGAAEEIAQFLERLGS